MDVIRGASTDYNRIFIKVKTISTVEIKQFKNALTYLLKMAKKGISVGQLFVKINQKQ